MHHLAVPDVHADVGRHGGSGALRRVEEQEVTDMQRQAHGGGGPVQTLDAPRESCPHGIEEDPVHETRAVHPRA